MSLKTQQGLGLLEVLIGLVVLSVGLLGASAMRLHAQAALQHAEWQHQALLSTQALSQAMRSNPAAMRSGGYTAESIVSAPSPSLNHPCQVSACSPSDRAEHDMLIWQQSLRERLPNAVGIVQATGPAQRRIVVMWSSPGNPGVHACPPPWPAERTCWILEASL